MKGREKFHTARMRDLTKRRQTAKQSLSSMPCGQSFFPTTFVAAVIVLFLWPSFGTPLSLPSHGNFPLDPCREFSKRSGGMKESLDVVPTDMTCPRYHADVFDGRVCLGCFCDDYEITNWKQLSFTEKAYALEDASDRVGTALTSHDLEGGDQHWFREGSIPVDELMRQASVWRDLAENTVEKVSKTTTSSVVDSWNEDVSELYTSETNLDRTLAGSLSFEEDSFGNDDNRNSSESVIIISSRVTVSSTDIPLATTAFSKKHDQTTAVLGLSTTTTPKSTLSQQEEKTKKGQQEERQQQTLPPPTPCTRICRYNSNCYDGKVCIGCFRDTHDIAHWSGMSHAEKMFSLEDAADRCRELSDTGQDTDTCFEGGISEDALRTQASLWGAWER